MTGKLKKDLFFVVPDGPGFPFLALLIGYRGVNEVEQMGYR